MKKWMFGAVVLAIALVSATGCAGVQVKQYGLEGNDTIALNLVKDPNVGTVIVTHVNGEATGGVYKEGFLGFGAEVVVVNPCYVKLTGKPIVFTLLCPVVIGQDSSGKPNVAMKRTEIRLTKLADLKAGDVLTLKWMYQTQTFAFMDATGNIVQQTIPTFE